MGVAHGDRQTAQGRRRRTQGHGSMWPQPLRWLAGSVAFILSREGPMRLYLRLGLALGEHQAGPKPPVLSLARARIKPEP